MICDPCHAEFFSPESWINLQKGLKSDLLTRAQQRRQPSPFCTICSTVLDSVKEALVPYLHRDEDESLSPEALASTIERSLASVREWPQLPVKVEKRIGRLSFIVGPLHSVEFVLDRGPIGPVDLNARLFILSPRQDNELEDRARLGTSTASAESLAQVRSWLDACNNGIKHPECTYMAECQARRWRNEGEPQFVPTRLLDVGSVGDDIVHVVDGAPKQNIQGPYATLSHKWGYVPEDKRFQLSNETMEELTGGFSIDKLPGKTFLQAVQLTRQLGLHYLWIDSLCINQGVKDDWLREGAMMEKIYTNSYCNLAAVDSIDGGYGLFREGRDPAKLPPDIVEYRGSRYALLRPDFWRHQLLGEPLYTRGWVLQERMLAPRILHFAAEQIFWQCPSLVACESSPDSLPYGIHSTEAVLELKWRRALHRNSGLQSLSVADLNAIWRDMVYGYTSCNLTKSEDKFVALIGVATAMEGGFGERFLAGLWDTKNVADRKRANLTDQLGWRVQEGKAPDNDLPHGKPSQRYEDYTAPTWSWACLNGIVVLKPRIEQPYRVYDADITHAHVSLLKEGIVRGPLRAESTRLEMSGKLVGKMKFKQTGRMWNFWKAEFGVAYLDDHRDVGHLLLHSDGQQQQYKDLIADVFLLSCYASGAVDMGTDELVTYSGHALVVKRTEGHTKEYARMGVMDFDNVSAEMWKGVQETAETVHLVLV